MHRKLTLKSLRRPLYLWNLKLRDLTNAGLFLQSLNLYSSILQTGIHGNEFTFPLLLKSCASLNSLLHGTNLHSHTLQLGFQAHVFVQTSLLDLYSKCRQMESARKVFDEMPLRTVVSWNSMISGLCRSGLSDEGMGLLREMRGLGLGMSGSTFVSLLPVCGFAQGLSIHCCVIKIGLLNCVEVALSNAFMSMYVKCDRVDEARVILDMMRERTVISWTTVIGGYIDIRNVDEAFRMFNQMRASNVTPDMVVFENLISGCMHKRNLSFASSLHSLILKSGCDFNAPIDNLLVSLYANSQDVTSAGRVFYLAQEKSVFLWTSMVEAYAQMGYRDEALQLLKKLLRTDTRPDKASLAAILSACADLGSLSMAKEIEQFVAASGLESNLEVQTSLIRMFSKCGSIENAQIVFDKLPTKDLTAWSAIINGFAIHGMGKEALALFHKMQVTEGIKPDGVLYTTILLACSHSGMVEDGMYHFQSMQNDFGIEPSIEHYTCLVDLLGRAGKLELALRTIKEMPVKVQARVWTPFLSACRKHRNIELGELAARQLLNLDPDRAGNYVVMANLYTSTGKWKEAAATRSLIDARGLVKVPGWSQIEIDGSVHVFIAGDRSHVRSDEIYKKWEELNVKLLQAGYVPETDTVTHDLENEEKEEALKVHSEKLAVAYGLISTETGTTLRIIKNLRTCDDCHSALKLISKITRRHLIIRDGHRFHHFESGLCSCKDFW